MTKKILSEINENDLDGLIYAAVDRALQARLSKTATPTDRTFTIKELAVFLKCSKVSVHAYKKLGLPYYRIGRTVIFKESEVLHFMKKKQKSIATTTEYRQDKILTGKRIAYNHVLEKKHTELSRE